MGEGDGGMAGGEEGELPEGCSYQAGQDDVEEAAGSNPEAAVGDEKGGYRGACAVDGGARVREFDDGERGGVYRELFTGGAGRGAWTRSAGSVQPGGGCEEAEGGEVCGGERDEPG